MKKIFQTDTTDTTGNCHQTAVASVFEFPINEIPNFVAAPEGWRESYVNFMRSKGYGVLFVPVWGADFLASFLECNPTMECFVLLAVESFLHKDKEHCVVGAFSNGLLTVVHDPNPANADRVTSDYNIYTIDIFFKIAQADTPAKSKHS